MSARKKVGRDPKSGTFVAIGDAEALRVAGLGEIKAERFTALQSFVPTGYLAVSVN